MKSFYHCLETIKVYGNLQTFIKKFAGNLLKFNVKLAPSPNWPFHVHFHILSRSIKNLPVEQSRKSFYHCLETIKGYLNIQTFVKKFADKLLN